MLHFYKVILTEDLLHKRIPKGKGKCCIFTVILTKDLLDRKIRIPPKFARTHGSVLPNLVTLKVPNGKAWRVELTRSGEHLFFHKGWQHFSDYLSLSFGHFLVFRYDGDGLFRVSVFDRTATETPYPNIINLDLDQTSEDAEKTSSGSSFEAVMRSSSLNHSCLTVPVSFRKRCKKLEDDQYVTLESDGRSWRVKLIRNGKQSVLSAGWSAFVKDNSLLEGDVCNFKLVETAIDAGVVFKVSVSRS